MSETGVYNEQQEPQQPHHPGGKPRLSPDERFEQAAIVEANARRNRPIGLVALAGVLFVVAMAAGGVGYRSYAAAQDELNTQRFRLRQTEDTLTDILRIQATIASQSAGNTNNSDLQIGQPPPPLSTIERLAQESGLAGPDNPFPTPSASAPVPQGDRIFRQTWSYEIDTQTLEPATEFLGIVSDPARVPPGLRISGITLVPNPARDVWRLSIEFERFYRAQ